MAAPFFASLEGVDHEALTATLLDEAEARWSSLPRFKRGALAKKDKTVLALFFTPAAARHSEAARAFSELLRALGGRVSRATATLPGSMRSSSRASTRTSSG